MGADLRALEAEEPTPRPPLPPGKWEGSRSLCRTACAAPPADRKEGGCREGKGCAKMNLVTERGTDCIF